MTELRYENKIGLTSLFFIHGIGERVAQNYGSNIYKTEKFVFSFLIIHVFYFDMILF